MKRALLLLFICAFIFACGETDNSVQSVDDELKTEDVVETDTTNETIDTTQETSQPADFQGYNMLLIGNSFFRPYAAKLDTLVMEAGIEDHQSTSIFRGGENGWPISFWMDSSTAEHKEIKAALDQGGIDLFGMTSGGDPENRIEGHKKWIDYALEKNPDISIFIAIPAIDYPTEWDQRAEEYGFATIEELFDFFVNDLVHDSIVEPLRVAYPNNKIFTIPTGLATLKLHQLNEAEALLDDIAFEGPKSTSLFTDYKGHQGQIILETGSLLWLNSIYDVDLNAFDYETGFSTDLHGIAQEISDQHNPNYKW